MALTVIEAILAVFKAVPVLDSWFQALMAAYAQARIDSMKKENLDAVRKAIQEKDQRDLEAASGNPHPGEPSNAPGSVIVPSRPPGADA